MNQLRGISLRPVTRADLPLVLTLFGDLGRSHLWGHRRVCDEEQLYETWRYWSTERMGAKMIVIRCGRPIGLVFDYERCDQDGHTKLATLMLEEATGRGAGLIATCLFSQWLFQSLPLRKIYLDVFEFNTPVVRMLQKIGLRQEMHRREHRFWNGRYWDQFEYSCSRDDLPQIIQRISRGKPMGQSRLCFGDARVQAAAATRQPNVQSSNKTRAASQAVDLALNGLLSPS